MWSEQTILSLSGLEAKGYTGFSFQSYTAIALLLRIKTPKAIA